MLEPELVRYIEHLQTQMMSPDYAELFDPARFVEWMKANPRALQRLLQRYPDEQSASAYINQVVSFEPKFKHDSYHSTTTFVGIYEKVKAVCDDLKISPGNPVIIVPSTSIGLSPLARPSSVEHILFAGTGTMAFCNYWAKAYAMLLSDFSQHIIPKTLDEVDLSALVRVFPEPVTLISRLLCHYAHFETLLGFGELAVSPRHDALRCEILQSMEVFAVAHELGHFVFEENRPLQCTSSDPCEAHEIEFFCDRYGQAVSRAYGAAEGIWSCFSGSGAVLYLLSGELSLRLARNSKVDTSSDQRSGSHPETWDRIARIVDEAIRCAHQDQQQAVRGYLNEILAVGRFLDEEVYGTVRAAIKEANTDTADAE